MSLGPSLHNTSSPAGSEADEEKDYNYYIPMADLLSGILFVILILLMSFAVIHYPDEDSGPVIMPPASVAAPSSEPAADAVARRNQELEAERRKLLQLIASDLEAAGVPVTTDMARSVISFPEAIAFKPGQTGLTFVGERHIKTLAHILARRATCYVPSLGLCPRDTGLALEEIVFDVSVLPGEAARSSEIADPNAMAKARAYAIASAMFQSEPRLLQFLGTGGAPVLRFQGAVAPSGEAQSRVSIAFGVSKKQ